MTAAEIRRIEDWGLDWAQTEQVIRLMLDTEQLVAAGEARLAGRDLDAEREALREVDEGTTAGRRGARGWRPLT